MPGERDANKDEKAGKIVVPVHHLATKSPVPRFLYSEASGVPNDSFVEWTVGEYQDYDEEEDALLKEVDDWALKNFTKGESIIILHWW